MRTLVGLCIAVVVSGLCLNAFGQAVPVSQNKSSKTTMLEALTPPVQDYSVREASASPAVKEKLAALRARIQESGARFTVRYTAPMDIPLSQLNGTVIPRDLPVNFVLKVNERAKLLQAEALRSRASESLPPQEQQNVCSATAGSFDWRKFNRVTRVRTQACGTCWDFTAMGAYEGSYALQTNQLIDTSEQYILNCAKAGNCQGGWWMPVFDFMISSGNVGDGDDPFTGNDTLTCPNLTPKYKATAWGFVGSTIQEIPSPAAIKQTLCAHGPLATALYTDDAFQSYADGVFDEHTQQFTWINHGITIIGWDDSKQAWLIKNSWGPDWGNTGDFGSDKGYAWVAYNTNNIGIATAWVDAAPNNLSLSPAWKKILKDPRFDTRLSGTSSNR
jgi:cathepsin L